MRRLATIAVLAAALAAGLVMLASFARDLVYPAPPVRVPSPPPAPLEEVGLELPEGGEVAAWALAPRRMPAGAPVALFFHGNGENLETMRRAGLFEELEILGVVALAPDYPGYGRSPGRPGEEGILATGEAALDWARGRHPDRPAVLVGWSLGAAVAIEVAARRPEEVAGVVAMSPWTTLEDVAGVHFPRLLVRWALPERYDSLAAARILGASGIPVLVIHGERDRIVPVALGRRIAETLAESGAESGAGSGAEGGADRVRWVPIPEAGHNDLLAHARVWEELDRFLASLSRSAGR